MKKKMSLADHTRISMKRKRPNPLFQEWLEELYEEAQSKSSKLTPMLKDAMESISKYPLPLKTGAECIILKGFERKLCIFLDKRLEVYYSNKNLKASHSSEEPNTIENNVNHNEIVNSNENQMSTSGHEPNNLSNPTINGTSASASFQSTSNSDSQPEKLVKVTSVQELNPLNNSDDYPTSSQSSSTTESRPEKSNKSKVRVYKPTHRSGGYAILIALLENIHENSNSPGLTKNCLIEKAQKHSDESFLRPKPQTYYTAWSNMTRLMVKGYVKKTKMKNVQYSLTDQGIAIATELLQESQNIPTINDIIFNNKPENILNSQSQVVDAIETHSSSSQVMGSQCSTFEVEMIEMLAGTFEVILLIDKNETSGVSKKNDPTVAQFNKYPDMKHEYRSLKVGDFAWIARSKINKNYELVLPYVVERKRMDDLGSSIKDGRFHEQKFRLRKCGLNNVIYLVENYGRNTHVGLPVTSLMQALANTRVQDGFKVHVTDSLGASCRFLAMMTKRLTLEYKNQDLRGCSKEATEGQLMTFQYFSKSSSKTKPLTVNETFIKLILQLKGVSVEKALAISNVYHTPGALMRAYQNCTNQKDAVMLLANLKYGSSNRNVGPSVSRSLYNLFSSK